MTKYRISVDQIDGLLADLTYDAQQYDAFEFGLPMGIPEARPPLRMGILRCLREWMPDDEIELIGDING